MSDKVFIDTLNLLNADPEGKRLLRTHGLEVALQWLVNFITPLHDSENKEVYLIVDSSRPKLSIQPVHHEDTFSFVYAPANLTADGVIQQWIYRLENATAALVVSNDRVVQHSALAKGAEVLSPQQFLEWCSRIGNSHQRSKPKSLDLPFNNPFNDLP